MSLGDGWENDDGRGRQPDDDAGRGVVTAFGQTMKTLRVREGMERVEAEFLDDGKAVRGDGERAEDFAVTGVDGPVEGGPASPTYRWPGPTHAWSWPSPTARTAPSRTWRAS